MSIAIGLFVLATLSYALIYKVVKSSVILWGNIKIGNQLNIPNDLVIDTSKSGGAEIMMNDLGIYNLMYNNSSVDQVKNIDYSYLGTFQKENRIKLDKLVINIPTVEIDDEAKVDTFVNAVMALEKNNQKVYAVQFDDFLAGYGGLYPIESFRGLVDKIKATDPNIKIIAVFYYAELLDYEAIQQRSSLNEEYRKDAQALESKYSGFLPFIDEASIWMNGVQEKETLYTALKLANRIIPDKKYSIGVYQNDYLLGKPRTTDSFLSYLSAALRLRLLGKINNIYIISTYQYALPEFKTQSDALKRYFGTGLLYNLFRH